MIFHEERALLSQLNYERRQIEGECYLKSVSLIRFNRARYIFFLFLSIITGGILPLCVYWWPLLALSMYYYPAHEDTADSVFIINHDGSVKIIPIESMSLFDGIQSKECKFFKHRYIKYVIQQGSVAAFSFAFQKRLSSMFQKFSKKSESQQLLNTFGECGLKIKTPTNWSIFQKEVVRPMYIFLIFNIAIQVVEDYYIFAVLIFISTVIGAIATIIEVKQANLKISQMAYHSVSVKVFRDEEIIKINSDLIVPGDIVFVNESVTLPFDCVVLGGEVLVNECALTGESVPTNKKPVINDHIDEIKESNELYSGTTIVQINNRKSNLFADLCKNNGACLLVRRTNFYSLKGQLVRKILYPEVLQNKFQRQSSNFLIFMFCFTLVTYLIAVSQLIDVMPVSQIIEKGFDLISITVPSTLPISMAIGIIYAIEKLKAKDIFTVSPSKIINGGLLDCLCFDKTGTLTEDHMDFTKLFLADQGYFRENLTFSNLNKEQVERSHILRLALTNMAANHNLVILKETGQVVGDPMEKDMFYWAQATLQTNETAIDICSSYHSELGFSGNIYKRFEFDSSNRRTSVICQDKKLGYFVLTKGSPQIIAQLVTQQTLPCDYWEKLKDLTSSGYRVLAIASKKMIKQNWSSFSREQIEQKLEFNGFQVFENKLKPETKAAISQLRRVDINPIMITGDNSLTGCSIAYECGMIDSDHKTIIIDFTEGKYYEEQYVPISSIQTSWQINQEFIHNNNELIQYARKHHHQIDFERMINILQSTSSHLCFTGNAFQHLFGQFINDNVVFDQKLANILTKIKVFARTKPNNKAGIIKLYQKMGKVVGMCGDGANDCSALNQANLGLSLSQTQSSIAASFTAKQTHIGSMIELIKQCRAGLATNFSLFNITASYAFIQFTSCIILYFFYSYPSDEQFVYWDLCLDMVFVLVVGNIETAVSLSELKPKSALFSIRNILELLTVYFLQLMAQVIGILSLRTVFSESLAYYTVGGAETNLRRYNEEKDDFLVDTIQGNAIFIISNFLYLFSVVAFTITTPWKKEIYTYIPYAVLFFVFFTYSLMMGYFQSIGLESFNLSFIQDRQIATYLMSIGIMFGIMMCLFQRVIFPSIYKTIDEKYDFHTTCGPLK